MSKNYYVSGEWNVTCDVCAKKIKSSQAKKRWDGLIVCPEDFEPRHEQDFVKPRQDKITVPFVRPKETPAFLEIVAASDQVIPSDSVATEWITSTSPLDTVSAADAFSLTFAKYLLDTVHVDDSLSTYGAGQYQSTDTVTAEDSGALVLLNYVDMTYFEDVYVGEVTSF